MLQGMSISLKKGHEKKAFAFWSSNEDSLL